MRFVNDVVLDAIVANATVNSPYIDASYLVSCSVQVVAGTGSVTGTVSIQASNDHSVSGTIGFTPTNWTAISGATVSLTEAGTYLIPKMDLAYQWLRVVFTDGSSGEGTSVITATFAGKGF